MSQCNILFLTSSLEPVHGFASSFVLISRVFFTNKCDDHSATLYIAKLYKTIHQCIMTSSLNIYWCLGIACNIMKKFASKL